MGQKSFPYIFWLKYVSGEFWSFQRKWKIGTPCLLTYHAPGDSILTPEQKQFFPWNILQSKTYVTDLRNNILDKEFKMLKTKNFLYRVLCIKDNSNAIVLFWRWILVFYIASLTLSLGLQVKLGKRELLGRPKIVP